MLVTLIVCLLAAVSGIQLTHFFDARASFYAHLCSGVAIGFAALSFFGFIAAFMVPFDWILLLCIGLACALPSLLLLEPTLRSRVRHFFLECTRNFPQSAHYPTRMAASYFVFYVLTGILVCFAFGRLMFVRPDGVYTGFSNSLGDLPFHLQIVTSFAHSHNFSPEDPTYAGSRFTYPFLADFIAALFVRGGASLSEALFVENVLLSLALVGVLHRWTIEMTNDRVAAVMAPLLVLCSGGFGWGLFLRDAAENRAGILAALVHPSRDYTIMSRGGWRWGNALTSLLSTQRSLLFGLPLAIIIFTQWWLVLKNEASTSDSSFPRTRARRMIGTGVLAGLLPLIHTHTWIVVLSMGLCLGLIFKHWKLWASFFLPALLISMPQVWWMIHGSAVNSARFFGWHLGWDNVGENALWFWVKNTGLFIPLLVAAVLWREKQHLVSPQLLRFYSPFVLCFLVPNAVKLAPWIWDNIKVLFYWYVASVPLVALLLAHFLRGKLYTRALGAALIFSLTFAGGIDIWRIISRTTEYQEFDREGMTIADLIQQRTEARALILHAPVFNSALYLTGRRCFLGYPGWLWSRGISYSSREADLRAMYAGGPRASALMTAYRVDYALIGPAERLNLEVNDKFFSQYSLVAETRDYRLYKIEHP